MKIILDSNFLLVPLQYGVDVYSELNRLLINEPIYELATIDSVIAELDKLTAAGNSSAGKAAELAKLKNVKEYTSVKATSRGLSGLSNTDNKILSFAKAGDVICTLDGGLKSAAKSKGIRVITLRTGGHLEEV